MADQKITQLTADATPTSDDLVVLVNDPGGTPGNKKATLANLATALAAMSGLTGAFAPATPRLIDIDSKLDTSGNITINSTSWANLRTSLDMSLTAQAGDILEVGISAYGVPGGANQYAFLDVATLVSGSPVTYLSSRTSSPLTHGVAAWLLVGSQTDLSMGGTVMMPLASGDISSGSVTVRLRYSTANAVNSTIRANTDDGFHWWAKIWRP